jgi:hypothetical protein
MLIISVFQHRLYSQYESYIQVYNEYEMDNFKQFFLRQSTINDQLSKVIPV